MKNSMILLPNFHVWMGVVSRSREILIETFIAKVSQWKFQWKSHDFLIPHLKNSARMIYQKSINTGILKISTFPRAIRYDMIYRYRIDISIFSIYRSITNFGLSRHTGVSVARRWRTHDVSYPINQRDLRIAHGENKFILYVRCDFRHAALAHMAVLHAGK